jgi:hypothetical protein
MLLEIERRLRGIDDVLVNLRDQSLDEFLFSMVLQYLCVRISGNLEICIREVLREYTRRRANPTVLRAVERRLASFQNPQCQRIIDVLSDFDVEWSRKFERFSTTDDMKDKIDSIVANRNLIAHGRPTGISVGRINEFNSAHRRTLEFIHEMIL